MLDSVKTVIALGYFDGVHLGHKKVIDTAKSLAEKEKAKVVVFSFEGNLRSKLNFGEGTFIFDKDERTAIYKSLGADEVYLAPINYNFLSMGKLAFLNMLNKKYDICCYVCGKDYRFGKFGKGSVDDILRYASEKNQRVEIVEQVVYGDKKISSTLVKNYLSSGEIKKVNEILSQDYSITGKVVSGRKVGNELGFPTANIQIENGRHKLKFGVYLGKVAVENKEYKAIINYGNCPTFDALNALVETHILGFQGDLYGKTLTVYFTDFIREIKKFSCKEKLLEQLKKDKERAING